MGKPKLRTVAALVSVCVITAWLVAGQIAQSQNSASNKSGAGVGEATRIHDGVMTERQRGHSKLYERPVGRDLRKSRSSMRQVIPLPWLGDDETNRLITPEELLQSMTCDADALVTGVVVGKTSQLTERGTSVFTDYDIQVEEVIKNNPHSPVETGGQIVVTRHGGAVELNGQTFETMDKSELPLEKGGRYLLFLQYLPSTKDYRTSKHGGGFKLTDNNQVQELTAADLPSFDKNGRTALVAQVSASVKNCGGK